MILALDFGSTTFKGALFGEGNQPVAGQAEPVTYQYAAGGGVEIPVKAAEACCRAVIQGLLRAAGIAPERLSAITLTSQAQTFTAVDASGQPLVPFVSWRDNRGGDAAAALSADPAFADAAGHTSFAELLPALQVCQLVRLRRESSVFAGRVKHVLPLPSYFAWCWSGEAVTDENLAAMSGLYSLQHRSWWPAALAAAELDAGQLPALHATGSAPARTSAAAAAWGLPVGLPIVLAGNDQTMGAYGAGLHDNGAVLIVLGTALVAYACTQAVPASQPGTARGPYPGGLGYTLAADDCGGSLVNWAQTVLSGLQTDDAFFAAAEAVGAPVPGDRLCFHADLPEGMGSWQGLALHHTPGHLARAVIECLSDRAMALVERLKLPGSHTSFLVAGGGSLRPFWCDRLAERLGVSASPVDAGPVTGAAALARTFLSRSLA